MSERNLAASVRARLLNKARAEKIEFNQLLTRYGLERMLYRLGASSHRNHFLLKGALLFDLWFVLPHRPTNDIDLLGFGSTDLSILKALFQSVCLIEANDGMVFKPESVQASEIRKSANYAGVRIELLGLLDSARCPVQIDVGFGDIVVPGPEDAVYPTILEDMTHPSLRVYSRCSVVAEKTEAMVALGMLNSRMKDFFDLWILAKHSDFDGGILDKAIRSTFERRSTAIPAQLPVGLTDEFAYDVNKTKQWQGFLRKNALESISLPSIIADLREFLMPILSGELNEKMHWKAGYGWAARIAH